MTTTNETEINRLREAVIEVASRWAQPSTEKEGGEWLAELGSTVSALNAALAPKGPLSADEAMLVYGRAAQDEGLDRTGFRVVLDADRKRIRDAAIEALVNGGEYVAANSLSALFAKWGVK